MGRGTWKRAEQLVTADHRHPLYADVVPVEQGEEPLFVGGRAQVGGCPFGEDGCVCLWDELRKG
ncbi:hypothetical protein FIBSPDRAFT_866884 [Athelia psychrophila]|uniref:Uncharacterized protein n=1 Tax=Athelia psychrophila TaxID=1759441 RepID=A0A166EFM4_9AGAM|nr:hypothetical protein FIBSPDRAFT_866884 [Fibularhizoctonia sp. CBS 109695]